eukprot:1904582-Prymnesium_polylepis.1
MEEAAKGRWPRQPQLPQPCAILLRERLGSRINPLAEELVRVARRGPEYDRCAPTVLSGKETVDAVPWCWIKDGPRSWNPELLHLFLHHRHGRVGRPPLGHICDDCLGPPCGGRAVLANDGAAPSQPLRAHGSTKLEAGAPQGGFVETESFCIQ